MTRIWEIEITDTGSRQIWERFNVTAKSAADALRKATKRQIRGTRITKIALIAEAE